MRSGGIWEIGNSRGGGGGFAEFLFSPEAGIRGIVVYSEPGLEISRGG